MDRRKTDAQIIQILYSKIYITEPLSDLPTGNNVSSQFAVGTLYEIRFIKNFHLIFSSSEGVEAEPTEISKNNRRW